MLRGLLIGAFFFTMTPLLISIQWLLDRLNLPGWGFIAVNYYRVLCRLLRIRVHVVGEPVADRAVLFVSNHISLADILVIGSVRPVAFVAKREVAAWPLVGITARLQRTVFVDRTRRHQTGEAIAEMVKRLVRVVKDAAARADFGGKFMIQPMSIGYTNTHGIPMGRQRRPLVAWYGDLDFMPHIKDFIARGAVDAVVSYGEPVVADADADRKAMAESLEGAVRALTSATLRGRPRQTHAKAS